MEEGWRQIFTKTDITSYRHRLVTRLVHSLKAVEKEIVLCVVLKGAAYFAVDLSRELQDHGLEHSMYFIQASSYQGQKQLDDTQLDKQIDKEKLKDKHVLIVDELYDSGRTLELIKQSIQEDENDPRVQTCVMFYKQRPDQKSAPPTFFGVVVPDVWLVGYGLDDHGKRRGLRSLYAIPPDRQKKWTGDDWRVFVNKE